MSLQKLVKKTVEINDRFKNKFGKQGRVISLVSEVGELTDAVLEFEGGKEKETRDGKGKEHIADALGDILYNVFLLANHYEVDLDEEYKRVLNEVEERLENGDFIKKT